MFRRTLLALTFVAALGAAGLGLTSKADAHGGCYRGGYGGHGRHHYGAHYAPYYGSGWYGSRTSYYGGYGASYYPYHRPRSGVYFSIGF